ncbi:MAG: hypothetical protein ABW215_02015 [Kibdelosporangium sp.]
MDFPAGRPGPLPSIDVAVLADGVLELGCPASGELFRCGPVGAAMWIALCQHGWEVGAAARTLATVWQVDHENMKAEFEIWLGELTDAGLVSVPRT